MMMMTMTTTTTTVVVVVVAAGAATTTTPTIEPLNKLFNKICFCVLLLHSWTYEI